MEGQSAHHVPRAVPIVLYLIRTWARLFLEGNDGPCYLVDMTVADESRHIHELEQKLRSLESGLDTSEDDEAAVGDSAVQELPPTENAEQDAETPSTIQQGGGLR